MGVCLVADVASVLNLLQVILLVALGLGAVIFVHELGHFVVAKLCGVRCEKFFVGFDIGGYKISRQWGETEYGIGILPLGGYVKMLGQDDNPGGIAEQMEKSSVESSQKDAVEIIGPDGKTYWVDRRSYLAKSVPQRMAIISAGVVMNVIFAFIFAVIAFGMGVPYLPCVVSATAPGSPGWEADLRTGDEIVRIGDRADPSFSQLTGKVTLADLERGVPFVVRRGATGELESIMLRPRQRDGQGLARVGITSPHSLRLSTEIAAIPGTPAATAQPPLEPGDEILRVGDQAVSDYRELAAILAQQFDQPLTLTVRRDGQYDEKNESAPGTGGREVTVTVAPQRMQRLGVVMKTGPVVGVQPDSPAAEAGILPGDLLTEIDGHPVGSFDAATGASWDPFALSSRLRPLAERGESVVLSIRRKSADGESVEELQMEVTPRVPDWMESMITPQTPVSIPELGLAIDVGNVVEGVLPDTPAAGAGLLQGDRLLSADLEVPQIDGGGPIVESVDLGQANNWPMLIGTLQQAPTGTKVKLHYARSKEEKSVDVEPVADPADQPAYVAERGWILLPLRRIRIAGSFAEQLRLGGDRTIESLLLVYHVIQKLGTQVPLTALVGPVTIAKFAGLSAFEGLSSLLIFLTILSANLAVVNFLPIPLLDGGHMVFLAYEGIFRRPANERFVVAFHTAGLIFLVGLMTFLIALDFGFIPRNL